MSIMTLSEAGVDDKKPAHTSQESLMQSTSAPRTNGSIPEESPREAEEYNGKDNAEDDDRELLILYASQTGSAQDVAEFVGREAWRRHFRARVEDVKDFDKSELLGAPPTIIITSTTGQGAFPTSLLPLWTFLLRNDLPPELLQDFHYTIFGLGDSSYPKFNWPARKLSRRLEMLGAQELLARGEGDDQHYLGIDGTLNPWLDNLWSMLLQHYPLKPGQYIRPVHARPPPRLKITRLHENGSSDILRERMDQMMPLPDGMQPSTLIQNKRVTAERHFQDTRHMILEFDTHLNYEAGDILELRPENLPEDVDDFLRFMKWQDDADKVFQIQSTSRERPLPRHWPRYATLRQLFISYLDVFSVPRRSFFEWLSHFTTSELETDKLREYVSTSEGQEEMFDYATRPRRTIFEVLQEFRSAHGQIGLEYIADIFPEIRPRQFSIASSCRKEGNERRVELLVAIVRYKTKLQAPRKGVATSWLKTLEAGRRIPCAFVTGSMPLPKDPVTPIILIGPGTGIAPFRAFVQERLALSSSARENLVFFGCRSSSSDFYFESDWTCLQASQALRFVLAASRDQEDKIYVQHRMTESENAKLLWQYVGQQDGVIYISGSAGQMPKSVEKALKKVFQDRGGMDEERAEAYLQEMRDSGRLQEETWS